MDKVVADLITLAVEISRHPAEWMSIVKRSLQACPGAWRYLDGQVTAEIEKVGIKAQR